MYYFLREHKNKTLPSYPYVTCITLGKPYKDYPSVVVRDELGAKPWGVELGIAHTAVRESKSYWIKNITDLEWLVKALMYMETRTFVAEQKFSTCTSFRYTVKFPNYKKTRWHVNPRMRLFSTVIHR